MRLDANEPNPLNNKATVYLDGVKQTHVIMADDELGEIRQYKRNPDGSIATYPEPFFEAITLIRYGKVEIRFDEWIERHIAK